MYAKWFSGQFFLQNVIRSFLPNMLFDNSSDSLNFHQSSIRSQYPYLWKKLLIPHQVSKSILLTIISSDQTGFIKNTHFLLIIRCILNILYISSSSQRYLCSWTLRKHSIGLPVPVYTLILLSSWAWEKTGVPSIPIAFCIGYRVPVNLSSALYR